MILTFHVGRYAVEVMVVNGLLFGFSFPKATEKPRLWIVNVGPLAVCCYFDLPQ